MHIRFLAGVLLCLGMLAMSPVAMAQPLSSNDHEVCILDLSQPATIDHAIDNGDLTCQVGLAAEVAAVVTPDLSSDVQGIAACTSADNAVLALASSRLHFDPGRCAI